MRVIVLGAGVIGVTTAWELAMRGCRVTVIERQAAPALETSFANGGQISVSHAEPWANPHTPGKALAWLGRKDAPLLFHCRFDPALFAWSLAFLRECLPGRTRNNIQAIVELALHSRTRLKALRAQLIADGGFDYDQETRGILHFYTDTREWHEAIAAAKILREFGCDRRTISADECIAIEPALKDARPLIVGGDYHADDESGDARRFTQLLAERAALRGVDFRFSTVIKELPAAGHGPSKQITGVRIDGPNGKEQLDADAYVLALGSYSPQLVKPLGIHLPVYPAKGYSLTFPLSEKSCAPRVSLTDDGAKIVVSRMGNRLRVAGTAEFNGYNLELSPPRLQALHSRIHTLFPNLAPSGAAEPWCGLRPATPSNIPLIGRSRIPNLWLNCGHGTLGWTLACGSADRLAGQMMAG